MEEVYNPGLLFEMTSQVGVGRSVAVYSLTSRLFPQLGPSKFTAIPFPSSAVAIHGNRGK